MPRASNADLPSPPAPTACHLLDDKPSARGGASLWLWVGAGFLFVALLWAAMFTAARQADTRTVPLATKGGRP